GLSMATPVPKVVLRRSGAADGGGDGAELAADGGGQRADDGDQGGADEGHHQRVLDHRRPLLLRPQPADERPHLRRSCCSLGTWPVAGRLETSTSRPRCGPPSRPPRAFPPTSGPAASTHHASAPAEAASGPP